MSGCNQELGAEEVADGPSLEQRVAEGRGRKARSDCKVGDLEIYVAIVTHMGIIKSVALALGIVRSTLYRRIERAPQLKACFDAARAVMLHYAWEGLDVAMEAKARWAIIFVVSRMHGVPMSPGGSRAAGSAANRAAATKKRATELVPQPAAADALTLRVVLGVEHGEPWAIKFCLSYLDPNGPCGINQVRGRKNEGSESELDEEEDEPQEEEDPEDAHDYEVASGHVQQQHGILTGRIRLLPAPPIVAESLRDSNSSEQPAAKAFREMIEEAPPLVKSGLETTESDVAINRLTRREGEAPAEPRYAVDADSLPQALHPEAGESPEKTESSVARGSAGASPSRHVDRRMETDLCRDLCTTTNPGSVAESLRDSNSAEQPDVNDFRGMIELTAVPPEAPPVVEANPSSEAHPGTTGASLGASPRKSQEFESRSDSTTLRLDGQELPDEIVTRHSRSLAAQKTTLRLPTVGASGAKQAAPPVPNDKFDDDAATDELFRRIKEMTKKFQALKSPPVPEDVVAFRLLLKQARARLPPAPPVR